MHHLFIAEKLLKTSVSFSIEESVRKVISLLIVCAFLNYDIWQIDRLNEEDEHGSKEDRREGVKSR